MPGRHRQPASKSLGTSARVALTATAAAMAVQPLVAQGALASTTTTVTPKPSRTLPTTLDVVPTYSEQRSCDPVAKPGVEAFVQLVLSTYRVGHSGGIVRGCGIGATSEHKEGRAFDWMLDSTKPAEKAAGDSVTSWLTGKDQHGVVGGNARRLGIMYIIWNKHIWGAYRAQDGWRPYSGASEHTDHVHFSFTWDGAMKRTSWWDGTATTNDDRGPCRVYSGQPAPVYTGVRQTTACTTHLLAAPASPYAIVWPGDSGSSVKVAQKGLGVTADGVFGSGTRSTLMSWQRTKRLPVTGVLDKPTWAHLVPSSGGAPAPAPTPAPTPAPAPAPAPLPVPVSATATTLTPYKNTTLRSGSTGAAVKALQTALSITADGQFGPKTLAMVKGLQTWKKLPVTGVVGPATWSALERAAYPLLGYRSTVLKQGSRGATVVTLQKLLHVTADGDFGAKTTAALGAEQKALHVPVTGRTDVATWVALEQAVYPLGRALVPASVLNPTSTPAPAPKPTPAPAPAPKPAPTSASTTATTTSVSRYKSQTLRQGSKGAAVTALQRALGMKHPDGDFGPVTTSTVKAFQKVKHLSATGVVDRHTWDAVELVAHPLLPYRTTVLRSGSTGKAVVALQKALHLTADGAFGPKTLTAVKAAQKAGPIAQTGTVATLTWVTIEAKAYPLGAKRW